MTRRWTAPCIGWGLAAGNCTRRPYGERRNPSFCDECDMRREAELNAQIDRRAREMREEVKR